MTHKPRKRNQKEHMDEQQEHLIKFLKVVKANLSKGTPQTEKKQKEKKQATRDKHLHQDIEAMRKREGAVDPPPPLER